MLRSQQQRSAGAEIDPLYYAMGWTWEDLGKRKVIIESTYGDSHPGSSHLNSLVEQAFYGALESGSMPARYYTTDICDGVCQGTAGMSYSLLSREYIAAMVEIHCATQPVDGLVLISSCDKAIPAHLLGAARCGLPAIFVPGGSMLAGADMMACDQMWELERRVGEGRLDAAEYRLMQTAACPSAGACQGMGTASTMQVIVEALGLTLPGFSLVPTGYSELARCARAAGRKIGHLIDNGLSIDRIVTEKSLHNAIVVHSAVCGSTNAVLHLSAFAQELGLEIDLELFDGIHREIPVLVDVQPVGKYPTEWFWAAGGVMRVLDLLRDHIYLDALTVTGRTMGENLEEWRASAQHDIHSRYLANCGISPEQVIRPPDAPFSPEGGLAILRGNLCPEGAIVKHAAVVPEMQRHVGAACVYDDEDEAIRDLLEGKIQPGSVTVIRYQGAKAAGMPEMFRISDALARKPELVRTTAIVTDGRYSGFTNGPAIGYVAPEAYAGGPLAVVQDHDLIEIDIPNRSLRIVGVGGERQSPDEVHSILQERMREWKQPEIPVKNGALSVFRKLIGNPLRGDRLL